MTVTGAKIAHHLLRTTAYNRSSIRRLQGASLLNYHCRLKPTTQNFIRCLSDGGKSSNDGDEPSSAQTAEINLEEYTDEIEVKLPGFEDKKGKIVRWYHKEGDVVQPNDTICDIETELFTFGMDIEDEGAGVMKQILVPAGEEEIDPGTPICIMLHKPMN